MSAKPDPEEGEVLPETEMLEKQKAWMKEVMSMLLTFKNYNTDRKQIDKFLSEKFDFNLYNLYGYEIILDVIQYFQAGITQKQFSVSESYICIVEKIYMMLTERNKQVFHRKFILEWQHFTTDYSPYYESLVPDYENLMTRLLNTIEAASAGITAEVFEKMRFLLILTPVSTLSRIWERAMRNPSVLPFAVDICSKVSSLFHDRPLRMYHNDYEPNQEEPLMALVFRRILFECRRADTTMEEYDALEILAMAYTNEGNDKPLMSGWVLLNVVFCELYSNNRIPTMSVEMLTGLASRILSPKNQGHFDWKFAVSMRAQPEKNVFLTPSIIDMSLQLMNEYHSRQESYDITENCKAILQCLGNRMREEGTNFDEETRAHLMDLLKTVPWWVEYAMSTWFWALDVYKRRIPAGIYRAICQGKAEEDRLMISENFEEIKRSTREAKLPPSESYILAIMELGLFDAECALELLHIKSNITFESDEEIEILMEKALKESFGVKVGLHGFEDARILMMQILEVFSTSSDSNYHERVALTLLAETSLPDLNSTTPLKANVLQKSEIIQSLAPPATENMYRSTGVNSGIKEANRLRSEMKVKRERMFKSAAAKGNCVAQHHRDTWADRIADESMYPEPDDESSCRASSNSSSSSLNNTVVFVLPKEGNTLMTNNGSNAED